HDVGLLLGLLAGGGFTLRLAFGRALGGDAGGLCGLVELGADLLEVFHGGLHLLGVVGFESLLGVGDGGLDLGLDVGGDLVAGVGHGFLHAVDRGIMLGLCLDGLLALLVFLGVVFGSVGQLLDLLLGETGGAQDGDLLFPAAAEVLGGVVKEAVGV